MNTEVLEKGLALTVVAASSYSLGIMENPEVEFKHSFQLQQENIDDDLTVKFVDDVPNYPEAAGLYTGSKIFVETGKTRDQVLEICRHEFLHHFVSEYSDFKGEEKLVEALDSRVKIGKCRELVERGDNYA